MEILAHKRPGTVGDGRRNPEPPMEAKNPCHAHSEGAYLCCGRLGRDRIVGAERWKKGQLCSFSISRASRLMSEEEEEEEEEEKAAKITCFCPCSCLPFVF
jgi:hypothetical protein